MMSKPVRMSESDPQCAGRSVSWQNTTGPQLDEDDDEEKEIQMLKSELASIEKEKIRLCFGSEKERLRAAIEEEKHEVERLKTRTEEDAFTEELSSAIPKTWQPMKDEEDLLIVTLHPGSPEYQQVRADFTKTLEGQPNIVKIEKIQNRTLYTQYDAKRTQISHTNKRKDNEHVLWHGTSSDAVESINAHGFNRSYCGKNSTPFGQGVYFTELSAFADNKVYSGPDAAGNRRIYRSLVLTGDYCTGHSEMRTPCIKKDVDNPHIIYDSVTNNNHSFVIFHDCQAYPEHLITYNYNRGHAAMTLPLLSTWTKMAANDNIRVVTLQPTTNEYLIVQSAFVEGVTSGEYSSKYNHSNFIISKIERIQNRSLYQQYAAKRNQLSNRNPNPPAHKPIERTVWHGTDDKDRLATITMYGFNRSLEYSSLYYGRGASFAADASFPILSSMWSGSHPPSRSKGYMFMVKALTGEYCQGSNGMRFLPPKDPSYPQVLYDSAVDQLIKPKEFVIFHDTAAYPQYAITFNM